MLNQNLKQLNFFQQLSNIKDLNNLVPQMFMTD